jgi:phosphomannomutase
MPLIKSVSGIRGTIGGAPGTNLTPVDIVAFTSAYAAYLLADHDRPAVVIGRDGRISGGHVSKLVTETLRSMGVDVIDGGLSTTPSIEMYVPYAGAQGGIIITASHNPEHWNALKFLNAKGEFISQEIGLQILERSESGKVTYADLTKFGSYREVSEIIGKHIEQISALDLVKVDLIKAQKCHLAVECINSTGAISIPPLLDALGCTYTLINSEVTGRFEHNPEPLADHLVELCEVVKSSDAMMGIAVDPDVDRLALVDEKGVYFGEEYTLVAVADYVLTHKPGACVSNLSSSQALRDLAESRGCAYSASKVGEVHVVEEMKRVNAVIGGEGNGGVIYPELHYGRDALVGIGLLLSHLAESGRSLSDLKSDYSTYTIAKRKEDLADGTDTAMLFDKVASNYPEATIDRRDGLKILFGDSWLHLRTSNTEPIIRVYAEANTEEAAGNLAASACELINQINN